MIYLNFYLIYLISYNKITKCPKYHKGKFFVSVNFQYRKPDTPLTKFYALGQYEQPTVSLDRISIARPGAAATLVDRNVRDHDDIAIKPHQTSFDKGFYKPGKYLNPRKEHNMTLDVISPATNMHVAKLMNMKKSAQDQ